MRLTFLGAAGTVTGSRYLLDTGAKRVLVDCGLFQGYKQLRLRNWSPPPVDPASIDAVVLTHAHLDHSGYIPRLVNEGFTGPVYCTASTFELCRILLPDSGHLQEEDAKYANRRGFSKHHPALPLYTFQDAENCLKQFKVIKVGSRWEPAEGIVAQASPAGHILGATFVRVEHGGVSVTFSGDLGRSSDALMKPPAQPAATDYLVIESTYGDRLHAAVDPEKELGEWLQRGLGRDGVVVIPTFAVGRAQSLMLHFAGLKAAGRIPDVPVFLDSPMAIDATALYGFFRAEHRLTDEQCRRIFGAVGLVNTPDQSKELDRRGGPMIILAASGMATGGRVLHHLKAFIGNSRNLVLFAGYQAPGTRGAALVAGARSVRIHGQDFEVQAEVGQLEALSAHADADELLAWMGQLGAPPRRVFVTHGEPGAADTLRFRIEHEKGWPAEVPDHLEFFDLA
ncbi:MAG: MBL fold metallo-hydrolase RNA specificity domain-containing protein [Steroidobacteraceae bacterium]